MARRPGPLFLFEAAALVAWLGMAAGVAMSSRDRHVLVPLDPAALTEGTGTEQYNGIFFEDQHVGYAVNRTTPTHDGGYLFEQRSSFAIATFGKIQEVVTAGAALTDGDGALRRFDFFMATDVVNLAVRGEVVGSEIVMEVDQAGETSELRFPIQKAPQVGMTLEKVIAREPLAVGRSFTVDYFDPVSMAEGQLEMAVVDVEVLENGEEAYWIQSRFNQIETRSLVLPTGETLRQEGALGMSVVRMTAEQAMDVPTSDEPVDLIALSAVKLVGRLDSPRKTRRLELRITGVDPVRVVHQPPLQTVEGDVVTTDMPLELELPELPVASTDPDDARWLEATATLPATNPEVRTRAADVVAGAPDRLTATRFLVHHVADYVEDVPVVGVPNGLEVLHSAQGDCNEHTALFVSLARAAGIPTRIAAGVVYSDRIGAHGAFYYHAWPEVRLGGPADWVPVDPTFDQPIADATHIKLVEGDLDRQVEIMGVMGKLGFELIGAR